MTVVKSKNLLKTSVLTGAVLFSTLVFSSLSLSAAASNCDPFPEADVVSMFTTIDYPASIAKLPAEKQAEAHDLLQQLEQINSQFSSDQSWDLETEVRAGVLEARLEDLFYEANAEWVEVNQLDKLSEADQLEALKLWRDIEELSLTVNEPQKLSSAQQQALDEKFEHLFDRLEQLLELEQ